MLCRACGGVYDECKSLHVEGLLLGKVTTLATLLHFCTGLDFMEQDNMLPDQICVTCVQKLAKACAFKQMVIDVDEYLRSAEKNAIEESCVGDGDSNVDWNQQDDTLIEYEEETLISECTADNESSGQDDTTSAETVLYNEAENVEVVYDGLYAKKKQELLDMVLDRVVEIIQADQNIEYETEQDGYSNEVDENEEELDIEYDECDEIEHITVERHNTEVEVGKDDDLIGDGSICNVEQTEGRVEELKSIPCSNVIHATQLDGDAIDGTEGMVEDDDTFEQPSDTKLTENNANLRCDICGKHFKTIKTYKSHIKRHDPFNPKSCEFCGKTYREEETLQKHLLSHTGVKPLTCGICGRDFRFRSSLAAHVRQHTGEKPFKCTECNRGFGTKRHLVRHASVHSLDRPYKCELCDKTFAQQRYLDMHKFRHTGIKPCQCHICGKSLSRTSELKKHFLTHTGEKPFKCDICSHQFRDPANLRVHKRQHTGDRPYACGYCEKRYATSTQLKAHTMLHTGERPHACSICGKGYRVLRSLQRHMLTHTGEKGFKCDQCSLEFRYESNLISHRRLHNRKESQCPNCDKSFRTLKLLNRHILLRHMEGSKSTTAHAKLKRNARVAKRNTEKLSRPQMPDVPDQKVCKSKIVELY